jgi:polysaccharide export outer membrane protein
MDAGNVRLALIGDLNLAGKTPPSAAKAIEEALVKNRMMLHPQVTVTIEDYVTQTVSIIGQVSKPGTYSIGGPQSIIKVLALAGGLLEMADRHITIERHADRGESVSYYLSNDPEKALQSQVQVYPGDTVMVRKIGLVYVLGDVGRPGGYPMSTNSGHLTALQAVAMAGSSNKTAIDNKAILTRKSGASTQQLAIRLSDMQHGKIPDVELQADDILFIPFSYMKNIAVGTGSIASQASSAVIYGIK